MAKNPNIDPLDIRTRFRTRAIWFEVIEERSGEVIGGVEYDNYNEAQAEADRLNSKLARLRVRRPHKIKGLASPKGRRSRRNK